MPLYDKIMLRKRSIIESVNDMLKNVAQLVHTRHRSAHNFLINLLAAMGAYCFFATKPKVNFDLEISDTNGQLALLYALVHEREIGIVERVSPGRNTD